MGFPFESQSTISVIGPSKCGKSVFVSNLLKNKSKIFTSPAYKIWYCYGAYQTLFDTMKKEIDDITFHEGLPENIKGFADGRHNILVLDDLQTEIISNPEAVKWFTVASHHSHLSVIYKS